MRATHIGCYITRIIPIIVHVVSHSSRVGRENGLIVTAARGSTVTATSETVLAIEIKSQIDTE